MVNPSLIAITSILAFVFILIIIFALTGHLFDNPYIIIIILLVGFILLSGFMILAYYKNWWPYIETNINNPDSNSNNRHNEIILYVSVGILVISSLLFAIVLYFAAKHYKNMNKSNVYMIKEIEKEEKIKKLEGIPEEKREEVPYKGENIPYDSEISYNNEIKPETQPETEEGLEETALERLALEHRLQEEGTGLETGSGIKVAARETIVAKELEEKNIRQDIAEEALEQAEFKDIEAKRALRTLYPSRTMFGPGGAEDIITGVRESSLDASEKRKIESEELGISPEELRAETISRKDGTEETKGGMRSEGTKEEKSESGENNNKLLEYYLLSQQINRKEPVGVSDEAAEAAEGETAEAAETEGETAEATETEGETAEAEGEASKAAETEGETAAAETTEGEGLLTEAGEAAEFL